MNTNLSSKIENELKALRNIQDALFLQQFFKTSPGQYGEGDKFLGVRNPQTRAVAKIHYKQVTTDDINCLLQSKWHEVRLCALVIMNLRYKKVVATEKQELYTLYLSQIGKGINNWDLIDISCPHIVGAYLYDKNRADLYKLAGGGLWQKRVSVISTFYFLREGDIADSLKLCEKLVDERHDLLQKAVGWTLREIGKVNILSLYEFLDGHAAAMPRTMLRYSLEKLPPNKRVFYMQRKHAT